MRLRLSLEPMLCLLVLTLMPSRAHAQTACPPGMEAYGVGVCGYSRSEPQQQGPQAPPPRWRSTWGAIATDSKKGALGAVTGLLSKVAAEQAAMADCQSKGGSSCTLQAVYYNQCAAMILGDKEFSVSNARDLDKAAQLGMAVCAKAGDNNCRVYYSACSPPVRVH